MDTRDFLDQVLLDLDVEAVRGRGDDEVVALAPAVEREAAEQIGDRLGREVDAEDARDACAPQADRRALRQLGHGFADRAGLAAADGDHELAGAFERAAGEFEVDAALEAVRGVGGEAVAARTTGDRGRREEGRFEEQFARLQRDAALLAAHDAGHRQRFLVIGDDEHVGGEFQRLLVEQQELFARTRHARAHGAGKARVVEGVQGLPEFEHDVVGDVDQRRDRADAAALQATDHPFGACRARIDAADDAAAVARAGGRRLQRDRTGHFAGDGDRGDLREDGAGAGERCDLARDSCERQAVGAVRRQLQRQHAVVEVEQAAHVVAGDRIGGERQQSRGVLVDAEFLGRAEHPRRLDAAHLGDLDHEVAGQHGTGQRAGNLHADGDVRRAADDLLHRSVADIDAADVEPVGVRVLAHFEHVADDDLGEGRRDGFVFLDFEAGHGQEVRKLVTAAFGGDEGTEPGFGEFHDRCLARGGFLTDRTRGTGGRRGSVEVNFSAGDLGPYGPPTGAAPCCGSLARGSGVSRECARFMTWGGGARRQGQTNWRRKRRSPSKKRRRSFTP